MGKLNRRGQATTEYVLVIMMIAGMAYIIMGPMKTVLGKLEKPLREDFARTYKYGDPKACGYDDQDAFCAGGVQRHPRIWAADNFRMFGRGNK